MVGKIFQFIGDSNEILSTFVLSDRELRVDIDNWDLILGDGSTPGGHRLLNQSNADARYQVSNPEVNGLGPFETDDVGLLARIGSYDYRLRKVSVSDGLTIQNPNGVGGDISVGIGDHITKTVTFDDDLIVSGVLQVDGGINADTAGTHTGDVVGNVTGNLTGNSTGIHTGASNGTHTGPVVGNVTGNVSGNAGTATALTTLRLLNITGDLTWTVGYNGTADSTGTGTLAATGVAAGSYGHPALTIDAKGRVTSAAEQVIYQGLGPGELQMWGFAAPPSGWAICNGQTVTRAANPILTAILAAVGFALPWGPGDGSTTITLPDFQGDVIRAFDGTGVIDPGRGFGSKQLDALQGFFMSLITALSPNGLRRIGAGASFAGSGAGDDVAGQTATSGPITDGTHGTPRIASETRMRNSAIHIIVRLG